MKVLSDVECVAVSKDDRFIAAGSIWGDVLVWDAKTYERVFANKISRGPMVCDVDFSPDSSRLVSADEKCRTATIWEIATRKKVRTLDHNQSVLAAKYSPRGDRIATAAVKSVRVWGADDGQLLVEIKVPELIPWHGLLWFNNHLFVKTKDSTIRQIDASTGSTISKSIVPGDSYSCIALPQHEKFLAHSTENNITFWDTKTHAQLALIPRSGQSCSIAFFPDDRLAIVAQEHKIIIGDLFHIIVRLHTNKFPF